MSGAAAPMKEADRLPRVRFLEHQGKQILFHDFADIMDPREVFPIVELSKSIVSQHPRNSLLTLTTVHNSRFNRDVIEALKSLMTHNRPFVKAGAIVGLSGLQRVVYMTVTQLTGRRLPTFSTVEEAKDWLVSQG